ncbi:MAG TPA: hypothetical protein PKH69_01635 [Thiobacillaceae bacterium]|nr:hypothetical protein [Thiobacillaceae bacterium]HNU64723.1 hypothetical protein [Thiobacillaceae bacterium]
MSEHGLAPHIHDGTCLPAVCLPTVAPYIEPRTCDALIHMAVVGAVVGGSAAAAHNALRMKRDEIELGEAMLYTGRAAIASAAATAVAGATANAVVGEGMLRLSVMFGIGAAMLYGLNRWTGNKGAGDA